MDSTGLLIMYKIYSKDGKFMYVNSTKHFEARKQWHRDIYLDNEAHGIKHYFIKL